MEWSSKEKSLLNFLTIILLFEYVYNMLAYMLAYWLRVESWLLKVIYSPLRASEKLMKQTH